MKKIVYLLLYISIILDAKEISFEKVTAYASKHALALQMKQVEKKIESKKAEGVAADYYPTLNLVYNSEYTESLDGVPLGTESIGGITISNSTRYQNSVALQLNYNLFHFGATNSQMQIANANVAIKDKEWCQAEKNLQQQLLKVYADGLKQLNKKERLSKMLGIREKIYQTKERLYKVGRYSKVDLGDEAILLISMQRDIENAFMQYRDDLLQLAKLSYMKIDKNDRLIPFILQEKQISTRNFEDTSEAQILKKKIAQKREEIRLKFRQQLPSLSLYSNYYLYSSHPTEFEYPISHIGQKSWNVGFSVRFNIFEGFKNSAANEQLQLELKNLQTQLVEAKHNFQYENNLKNTQIKELEILKTKEGNLLQENKDKLQMVMRLRENQRVDKLQELNTQYELLRSNLNLAQRVVDIGFQKLSLIITNRGVDQCTQH